MQMASHEWYQVHDVGGLGRLGKEENFHLEKCDET